MSDPLGTIRTTPGRGAVKVSAKEWFSWTNELVLPSKDTILTDADVATWSVRTEERCGDTCVSGHGPELPGCSRPRIHTITDTQFAGHSMYPFPGDYLDYLP